MKLIDKDVLTEKLWERRMKHCDFGGSPYSEYGHEDDEILSLINSLEVKEVDLEHEVESYWKQCDMTWCRDAYSMTHIRSMLSDIAKHFFELGISINNSTKVTTPDVDDVLKENGVNPDSKEAKIIKESYFMAIGKLAQKGEEV